VRGWKGFWVNAAQERAKQCDAAPTADHVARKIAGWIEAGKQWIGTFKEPYSFKLFKYLFALAPDFFIDCNCLAGRKEANL